MYPKNKLIFILLACSASTVIAQSNQHVVYGERGKYFESVEDTYQLFFDKNGDLYPNTFIADQVLIENEASLKVFYSNNVAAFIKEGVGLGLSFLSFNEANFEAFQEALIKLYLLQLNNDITENSHLHILIHGFRKPMISQRGGSSAMRDNESLKDAILSQYSAKVDVKFLEIYWDGPNGCVRRYDNAWQSFRDHSLYLTTGTNAGLCKIGSTNYQSWAKALGHLNKDKEGFEQQLLVVIREFELDRI